LKCIPLPFTPNNGFGINVACKLCLRAIVLTTNLSDIVLELEDMGFDIEASHHEVAPGQHEIDFKYADAEVHTTSIYTK
jgi:hypothetical protein